jgi:IclR family acetate operon transcriptional repressor
MDAGSSRQGILCAFRTQRRNAHGSSDTVRVEARPQMTDDAWPESPDRPAERRSGVQSVDRAFAALDVLGRASGALTVQEVARRSGLDRTVAHRLLKTLKTHHAVVEDSGSYQLGPQTVLMATRYTESLLVRRFALPYMLDLQSRDLAGLAFTVNLSIAIGDVSAVLERIWTPSTPLDLVLASGDLFPLDRTATGRSILSHLDDDAIDQTIGAERHAAIRIALESARANGGLAMSEGEAIPGVRAMAAAILGPDGTPVAAIGISSPNPAEGLEPGSALGAKLARSATSVGRMLS